MPDLDATCAFLPSDLRAAYPTDELLTSLLETSLTGIALYSPIWGEDGTIVDFSIDLLNPAAQRIVKQPARPVGTFLEHFSHTLKTGVFAFQCEAFESGIPAQLDVNYQGDGLDNYFRLAARRVGKGLLVSFTDTADQPRTAVEVALRASQAAEQAARADAENHRAKMRRVFEQAPVAIAIMRGPNYIVELANVKMGLIWGRPLEHVVGKPHFEALPDLRGQGFEEGLAEVFRTGIPYYFKEALVYLSQASQPYHGYFNITYQPSYNQNKDITGIIASAVEVTEQVVARQQVQHLNEELSVINEELQAANEEYLLSNTELTYTQQLLQDLNQELEMRVAERTVQLESALEELRQQQQKLADQQEMLKQIMEQVPAAIASVSGPEYRYSFANEAYKILTNGRMTLGQSVAEAFPEVVEQGFIEVLDRVYKTEQSYQESDRPLQLIDPVTGQLTQLYMDLSYQPMRNKQGQMTGILAFMVDVTEKVLARHRIEMLQAQVVAVFEQAPVAVFVLSGPDHLFEVVNPPMSKLLGRSAAQMLGHSFFEVVPELAAQGYQEVLDEVWRTGTTRVLREREGRFMYHGPGELSYFNFVYQPLRNAQGEVISIACVATEVTGQVLARQQVQRLNTELRATNHELRETNQQLMRTNVDLDNFIYTASHDLKAPIANIEGLLLAIQRELPAEGRVKQVPLMLGMMQHAIERFRRTISHLTDVSSLQKEHAQPAIQVNLAQVVREMSLDLAPLLTQTAAQLTVAIPEDSILTFSEKNLRSIVYNLLSNALKYHHPDRAPEVCITYWTQPGQHVFSVQDNGLGLDLQGQQKLFGMFQRLHTHVEGTGIGLYMVKKIVENAGGTIEVESQLGQGSTFTVCLPA